jgi:simple sugar transport system permease protein
MTLRFLLTWFTGNAFDAAAVLITASLGAFVTFRMRLFNFGGEGQMYAGGVAASAVILFFQPSVTGASGGFFVLALAGVAGMCAGGALGAISGVLKERFGAGELLSTFLVSASLIPLCDSLVIDVLRDKGASLLASEKFAPGLTLPRILAPSNLSLSFLWALALVFLFYGYLNKTGAGYRFFIAGAAPGFAAFGGIRKAAYTTPALALSGGLHGLAGFFFCAGSAGRLHLGFSGGVGWNAIAIALLAGTKPLALIPAALLFCAALSAMDSAALLGGLKLETKLFLEALALLAAASARSIGAARLNGKRSTGV